MDVINKSEQVIESSFNSEEFPLILSPSGSGVSLSGWVKDNRRYFENKLSKHGAILFRGFGIDTLEKFESFMNSFENKPLPYMFRSSPRKEISKEIKNVYHSTVYPEHQAIAMHNESSYSRVWGMKIVFCCLQPAAEQGETPIADSRKVLKDIPPALLGKFRISGVKYVRNLSPDLGLSWKEVFQVATKDEMISICDKFRIEYRFRDDDNVSISWVKPAIYTHPHTNEEVWFNHSCFFNKYSLYEIAGLSEEDEMPEELLSQDTCFGNGEEISYEEFRQIKHAFDRNTVLFPYQKGDVLFLDNMLAAHGRSPFTGERLIATSIIEPGCDAGFSIEQF